MRCRALEGVLKLKLHSFVANPSLHVRETLALTHIWHITSSEEHTSENTVLQQECERHRKLRKYLWNKLSVIHQRGYHQNPRLFPWAIFQGIEIAVFYRRLPWGKHLLCFQHVLSTPWEGHQNGWNCLKELRDKRCAPVSRAASHDSSMLEEKSQS